ncbi:MFS transporter [Sphingomonas sp. BIUV-7]|uniref:MFS transporter n=1 Tax=Sphingomonas natans TaxID=3063330 RepID=A0ABT8Y427_9SPHN|nr:MFS transporter [Sphingomonas sp. BIUV-7]MDO6413071.1 MFS transporter [Sphingomonas sp. BIUV-7]
MHSGITRGSPAYRRLSWAMLLAGLATFSLLYSVQPLLPVFSAEYGVSAEAASLAVSLATAPMALLLIPAGILSDRIGRRPLMIGSLVAAAMLTILSAIMPGWETFLAMRFLTGVALAGIPAVAMTYLAEEVDAGSVGSAMGLYIAGSAIGGMSGRFGIALLTDWMGWRTAEAALGATSLIMAAAFWRTAPVSRLFVPRRDDLGAIGRSLKRLAGDAALPYLYAVAFLLMGALVTIYNYIGFRLTAPPFALGQSAVGAIFLLYLLGSASSTWFGGFAGRIGRRKVQWVPIALLLAGVLLTAPDRLELIILGLALITIGFFGGHSIASSWVGRRAMQDRALASACYLLFYYLGSSILGSVGGVAWTRGGWHGIVLFVGALAILSILAALRLVAVKPLPFPESGPTPELPPG